MRLRRQTQWIARTGDGNKNRQNAKRHGRYTRSFLFGTTSKKEEHRKCRNDNLLHIHLPGRGIIPTKFQLSNFPSQLLFSLRTKNLHHSIQRFDLFHRFIQCAAAKSQESAASSRCHAAPAAQSRFSRVPSPACAADPTAAQEPPDIFSTVRGAERYTVSANRADPTATFHELNSAKASP